MKTVVHLTCDYPDPLAPSKTRSVKNLIDNTPGVRHVIYSLNRVSSGSATEALDVGSDLIAVAYHAPPYGIFHRTYLLRLAEWILGDLSRRGIMPDLVHAHKFSVEGIVALEVSRRLGSPFIVDIWGDTDLRIVNARSDLAATWKAVLGRAAAIIPCAPWAEDKFHALFGFDRRKATILPPIVMHETFRPSAPSRSPALVTLFNLNSHRRKNFSGLVSAVVAASRRRPGLTLSVYGACAPATLFELRKILRDADADGVVTLEGPLDNSVFSETLNTYSAFVMPTRRETFGMVFVEALFAGLPLLHSKGWGIDGFFPDETIGYACEPTDHADIGRGLEYLLDNESLLKSRIAAFHADGGLDRFKRSSISATYREILERAAG
jgi:glycosyltransferase involved in cell wall biosynthesis